MNNSTIAGLDIGSSAIRLVVVETARDAKAPRVLAQVKKESRGLRRGYIINFDETLGNLRAAIDEAERVAKIRLKSVILGIGGITLESKISEGQVIVSKADLEINETDLERALAASETNLGDFVNRHILHSLPISFKLDGKKILGRPEGLKGHKLEVKTLFIHALNQHLNDLTRVVEQAGLSVEEVTAAPWAASLPTLSPTQKAAGCLLANIGSQTTSVITFEEGVPIALQVLPIGSNDITNDIALGLRVSLDEAERIKLDPLSALTWKRKLDEIIEARLVDMFELIDNHLKKIGRSGLLPAGIIIVGGGASTPDLERLARASLRLPTKVWTPLDDPLLKNQLKDASWAVAYGLCLAGLESDRHHDWLVKLRQLGQHSLRWFKDFWP